MKFNLTNLFKKSSAPITNIPNHIAIIMDGNGRWARQRGMPRTAGHRVGMDRVRDAVSVCLEHGVPFLTLYAFSTENWKRPEEEVRFLMDLFEEALKSEVEKLNRQNVQVRFIGLRHNLRPSLRELMEQSEALTSRNTALTLNLAINYGGRSEIIAAVRKIAAEVRQGEVDIEQINESFFGNYLFTAGQPDPDLLIKPGGESRISNFLLWQIAYTEIYYSTKYWPDFNKADMRDAIAFYSRKERRFGGVKRGESV